MISSFLDLVLSRGLVLSSLLDLALSSFLGDLVLKSFPYLTRHLRRHGCQTLCSKVKVV
jgi:hypothetical protein